MRTSAKKPASNSLARPGIATPGLERRGNPVSQVRSTRDESPATAGVSYDFSAIPVRSRPPATAPAKPAMHAPGDLHEQEADRVAAQLAGPPQPGRAADTSAVSTAPLVQRRVEGNTGELEVAPAGVHETLSSPGQPLDTATRAWMEPRFGRDFSQVRVHTDGRAAESARAAGALAYTVGRDIVFGSGQYAPQTATGTRLLAHELTHTVQQGLAAHGAATGSVQLQRKPAPTPPTTDATANSAQLYQQALGRLKALDPTLFGYLSKAALGAGPTEILRENMQGQPGVPSLSTSIQLDVKLDSLAPNKDAEFSPGMIARPAAPGAPFVFAFNMAINQSIPADETADSLAQILVHEGTHLQIAIDKVVFDPAHKSPHAAAFGKYQTTAKSLASYENLLIFLNNYMEMVLTKHKKPTDEATRQKDAQKIMDLLLEEKYVYDQDKAKFGTSRTNAQLAADYIKDGLDAVGIPPSANLPNLNGILVDVEDFLNELDAQMKPASTPAPAAAPGGGKP